MRRELDPKLAEAVILDLLSDGEVWRPREFADALIGGVGSAEVFMFSILGPPRWNRTPFCTALARLIVDGKVRHWEPARGVYCYQLAEAMG